MKVAAVQMDIKILEKERNLEKILDCLESTAQAGAGIVVFPECALTGYCFTSLEEAAPVAEPVPGPASEALAAAALKLDCTAVVGMLERDGDKVYNSALVVTPQGIAGTFRKLHLPYLGIDRFVTPGDKPFPVFETAHGKLGINICFDCSFPEAGRVLKLKGVQLLAIATNWPIGSDSWQHTPKVRASETILTWWRRTAWAKSVDSASRATRRLWTSRARRWPRRVKPKRLSCLQTLTWRGRTAIGWLGCRDNGNLTAFLRAGPKCTAFLQIRLLVREAVIRRS